MVNSKLRLLLKLYALMAALMAVAFGLFSVFSDDHLWFFLLSITVLPLMVCVLVSSYLHHFLYFRLAVLKRGLESFKDGDFGSRIKDIGEDDLAEIITIYNDASELLHQERLSYYQRELLLDTIIQRASLAMILADDKGLVVHENLEARELLNYGRTMKNMNFVDVLNQSASSIAHAIAASSSAIVEWRRDEAIQTYHISCSSMTINQKDHLLYLFKNLTVELSREEVKVWKKMIRVMSHELNNSLAPISSMAHSGKTALEMQRYSMLPTIFDTISSRVYHLNEFLQGYSDFSKLPMPNIKQVRLLDFFSQLCAQSDTQLFFLDCAEVGFFDEVQLEQALLNLVKNALESGSLKEKIKLYVSSYEQSLRIRLVDRGSGMPDSVLENALLPFYSTKSGGTGIGLALCHEIIQAHGGSLSMRNRRSGGLSVQILLPLAP